VTGDEFYPYGFERNRARVDAFAAEAFRPELLPPLERRHAADVALVAPDLLG
jgi:hypothetical protein